ncbi:MAG: ABC transporter substrate-binding protein [Pseudomonadota bacterium]
MASRLANWCGVGRNFTMYAPSGRGRARHWWRHAAMGILLQVPGILAVLPTNALAEAPARVVSMNLCTDQLAMMIGAPGQVVSVSHWSARPSASNMAEAANALPLNIGSAEQIYLMRPDLVLAGAFTNRTSVDMLRRLGIQVEIFRAAKSLEEVSETILRLGRLLGRDAAAKALDEGFRNKLAVLEERAARLPREGGAYHFPNNYTSGAKTLGHGVMDAAGLDNAAAALGLTGAARLDLEALVMLDPFLIRTQSLSGTAIGRSYEPADHPALEALTARRQGAVLAERWQVCGTPFVTHAIEALIDAREHNGGPEGGTASR